MSTYDYIPGAVKPAKFLRKAPRNKHARKFDQHTFLYDIFFSADNSRIFTISPPDNRGSQPWYKEYCLQVAESESAPPVTLNPVRTIRYVEFLVFEFNPTPDMKVARARVVTAKTQTPWQTLQRNDVKPATLVVTTLIKNENHNLREWIEYHRIQGVDRFLIYDNNTSNRRQLFETLAPYRDIVTLVRWDFPYGFHTKKHPSLYCQKAQITHSILKYGGSGIAWMIVTDVDEFICSPRMPLLEYLRGQPDDVTGIRGTRLNFGREDPNSATPLALGRFPRCEAFIRNSTRLEKYVIRPGRVTTSGQHYPVTYTGRLRQTEQDELRFHHYQYTSAKRRKVNPRNQRVDTLRKFVPEIEQRIAPVISVAEIAALIRSKLGERKRVLFYQVRGNGGDSIISAGAQQMLLDHGIAFEYLVNTKQTYRGELIVMNAAGNLTSNYKLIEGLLRSTHKDNDVILLPCSVEGRERFLSGLSKRVTIIARERFSYAHVFRHFTWVNQLYLAHDMAFYLRGKVQQIFGIPSAAPQRKLLHAFRRDSEKPASGYRKAPKGYKNIDVSHGLRIGPHNAANAVAIARKMLVQLGEYKMVKTDRLHGAIAAWLMGRSVELHSNSYYKNRGIYHLSLRDAGGSVRWRG